MINLDSEIASSSAQYLKSEWVKFNERHGNRLSQSILDTSKFHSFEEWNGALKSVKWKSGILQEMGLQDTPENRSKVVVAFLRDFFEQTMPGIISRGDIPSQTLPGIGHSADEFSNQVEYYMRRPILKGLPVLLDGKKYASRFDNDPHSPERHNYRAGVLKRTLVTRIFNNADMGNDPALHFKSFYRERYKYLGLAFLQGFSHDWGRWATHSSEHDEWTRNIISNVFPENISTLVLEGIHDPVPHDRSLSIAEIDRFDSDMQRLNRVADVFGKLTSDKRIRTLNELLTYSRERQETYFRREADNPRSDWYNRTNTNLETYLNNEKEVLKKSLSWLESVGIRWEDLVADFNASLNFQAPHEYYKHMEGFLSFDDQALEV